MKCEHCGSTEGVELEDSRTCYASVERSRYERLCLEDPLDPPDLNDPVLLCRECAAMHHEFWDEMWSTIHG